MKHATRSITQGLGECADAHRATDAPHGAVLHRLRPTGSVSLSQERVFGSPQFIRRGRNPSLESPARFEPTTKGENDVVI
jgi:hypothetical protein